MNPEQLRDTARAAYDRQLAKQNLKILMASRLTVAHRDGVFNINTDLFVLLGLTDDEEMVILDAYDVPVLINRTELITLAKQRYQEIMNEWLLEYTTQSQVRNAQQL